MPTLATGMTRTRSKFSAQSGFSLIELLVVIAIIGVMVTGVTLMFGRDRGSESVKTEAYRLAQLLRLARDEAQLNGVELGLVIDASGYGWLTFKEETWLPIVDDKIFRWRTWPDDMTPYLKLEQFGFSPTDTRFQLNDGFKQSADDDQPSTAEDGADVKKPQIIVTSAGEITPFILQLEVETDADTVRWMVRGHWQGEVDVQGPLRGQEDPEVWLEAAL